MSKAVITKIENCLSCHTCEIACALAHAQSDDLAEAMAETPPVQERLKVGEAEGVITIHQCRQCPDAPCIEECPKDALTREDSTGVVVLNAELCIGCKLCIKACPYDAMLEAREGKVPVKCDLCPARVAAGEEPACVVSCPTGAMMFVEDDKKET